MDRQDPFVDELVNIQRSHKPKPYTDGEMAKLIGCSRQLYQHTRTGKVSVGIKILRGGVKAFPQLRVGIAFADIAEVSIPHQSLCSRIWDRVKQLYDGLLEGMK